MIQVNDQARRIALCGKGGTGKTALTALIARALAESRSRPRLLVVDADPAMGLHQALGVEPGRNLGEVREEVLAVARGAEREAKIDLARRLDYLVFSTLRELDGFVLLAMGRTDARGCFCPVNELLRDAIDMLSRSFEVIIIDGEAGLEQINRQVVRRLDTLLIVSDSSARGLNAAVDIERLVRSGAMECSRVDVVLNRVRDDGSRLRASAEALGLRVAALVPEDAVLSACDLAGDPLTRLPGDSPAMRAVRELAGRLLEGVGA